MRYIAPTEDDRRDPGYIERVPASENRAHWYEQHGWNLFRRGSLIIAWQIAATARGFR